MSARWDVVKLTAGAVRRSIACSVALLSKNDIKGEAQLTNGVKTPVFHHLNNALDDKGFEWMMPISPHNH
jgi:hypothetical protein